MFLNSLSKRTLPESSRNSLISVYGIIFGQPKPFIVKVNTLSCDSLIQEAKEMVYPPRIPKPLKRPEEQRWPSPTPLPAVPAEDIGKILKQILERLDTIEKRLDNIEKLLAQTYPSAP